MTRMYFCTILSVIALLAWPSQTKAAESYDNCTGFIDSLPATIGTQGTWCLRKDLSTAMTEGNAIEIATNNVTLDCNDFKIGGLAAGPGTFANGVRANSRFNIAVRNCRIRGFLYGVVMAGQGGGHKIEGNSLEGSRSIGMFIAGAGSVVRGNRIVDSGGSTSNALAVESGIEVVNGVDVIDNLINGVRPPSTASGVKRIPVGIRALVNDGGSIVGNRVSGLVPSGAVEGIGILVSTVDSRTRSVVSGNILKGSGSPEINDTAIACPGGDSDAISTGNVLTGFDTALDGCSPGDNSVNSN